MSKHNHPKQLRPIDLYNDLNGIADLVVLCFSETLDEDGFRFIRRMRQAASSLNISATMNIMGIPQHGFVWEENNRIVGNITIVTTHYNRKPGYVIANVSVHPDYRRLGIARMLTEAALNFIESRRVSHVLLHANENNPAAQELYQKFGFSEYASRTSWFVNPGKISTLQTAEGVTIKKSNSKDWGLQNKWLTETYPQYITWHLPYKEHLFRPGFFSHVSRLIGDRSIRQWSAFKAGRLIGTVCWQSSARMADWLWLGVSGYDADLAAYSLLNHAITSSRTNRKLLVNYPAGLNVDAFTKAGFKKQHTLIWMKLKNQ